MNHQDVLEEFERALRGELRVLDRTVGPWMKGQDVFRYKCIEHTLDLLLAIKAKHATAQKEHP